MGLTLSDISVSIEEHSVLSNINLAIEAGTVHLLMGPNGSGKSSLAYTIAGHPRYTVTHGSVWYQGSNITKDPVDVRARKGIFISFQAPCVVPGVNVLTFLKNAYEAVTQETMSIRDFTDYVKQHMALLHMDPLFLERYVNEGFSGGEKKRFEMLQLLVLRPNMVILDEIDSGLDVDALRFVMHALEHARKANPSLSCLAITHYPRLINYVEPDMVHVMHKGTIAHTGDAAIISLVERKGYDAFCR